MTRGKRLDLAVQSTDAIASRIASGTVAHTSGIIAPGSESRATSSAAARRLSKRTSAALQRLQRAVRRVVRSAGGRLVGENLRPRQRVRKRPWSANISVARHWERLVSRMLRFGGASVGNKVTLFCNGDDAIEAIWETIESAQRRIWFEMYTIEPDRVGMRTLEALSAAAKRGCEVILLCDSLGSSGLKEAHLAPLRTAGATIVFFNPLWRWRRLSGLLRRDHRKIIVVDDEIGFCGGMNISENYAGERHGNCRFHDMQVKLTGPCVRDLARVTSSSFRMATRRKLPWPRRPRRAGGTFVQVLASTGWTGRRPIQRSLRLVMRNAVDHCYIITPYFIPPARLVRALIRAARRGVDVRILTAGVSDVPVVRPASQHIYGSLLRHGVRIYEMHKSTLHAKAITVDGLYSTVGSFNLDTWSDKRNLEVNVALLDPDFAQELRREFLNTIAGGTEITFDAWRDRPWWRRLGHWMVYQLLRL